MRDHVLGLLVHLVILSLDLLSLGVTLLHSLLGVVNVLQNTVHSDHEHPNLP